MLIAEDLLLLLTDDATGKLVVGSGEVDVALGGANLIELTLAGRVDVTGAGNDDTPGRLVLRDAAPVGDPVLDAALETLAAHEGKKPSAALGPLSKHLRPLLYERLAGNGILRSEKGRILGIFPTHSWPAEDAAHEAGVRRLLHHALVDRTTPDPRTAALVSLLHAVRALPKVVPQPQPRTGMTKRELEVRAEQIAEGSWAAEAVGRAIDEMMVAVLSAATAATSAAAITAGS